MKNYQYFKELIKSAKKIVISTHLFPDADGIGSQVALALALRKYGKDVICVNEESLLTRYNYLAPNNIVISYNEFIERHQENEPIDLFIVVDTNAANRIGTYTQKILANAHKVLYIDHHPAPPAVSAIHCIDTNAAATGQVVGQLIESIGINFDQEMALALYTAIMIDTSSFRYPTVSGSTHNLIAKLIDTGIEPPLAYNGIYGTKKITHMRMIGKILSTSQTNDSGEIAWITVEESLLKKYDVDLEDTHSFINYLLVLDNIKVVCMFRDIGEHIKISFRSSGETDVGSIAQSLGGGGHYHSSATIMEGKLKNVIKQTIKQVESMLQGMN